MVSRRGCFLQEYIDNIMGSFASASKLEVEQIMDSSPLFLNAENMELLNKCIGPLRNDCAFMLSMRSTAKLWPFS